MYKPNSSSCSRPRVSVYNLPRVSAPNAMPSCQLRCPWPCHVRFCCRALFAHATSSSRADGCGHVEGTRLHAPLCPLGLALGPHATWHATNRGTNGKSIAHMPEYVTKRNHAKPITASYLSPGGSSPLASPCASRHHCCHMPLGPPCFDSRVLMLNGLRSQLAAKFRWKVGFFGKLLENNQMTSTMSTGNAIAGSQ